MLDYYKVVLGNVTFDAMLFRKELRKAMRHLTVDGRTRLRDWLKQTGLV
jgi:predicted transposase YbfD/YdcC